MSTFVTLLRVKAVQSDGERWIEGYATTPQEDRVRDVVSPRGAVYTLPIPLLFAHAHDQPIGSITEATVSEKGIRIRARLSVGVAKAEEVWTLIKDGVLTAVSIGFRVLEQTPLPSGGLLINSWEWLETSVVAVPCNPGALISVSKCVALQQKDLQLGSQSGLSTVSRSAIDQRIWADSEQFAKETMQSFAALAGEKVGSDRQKVRQVFLAGIKAALTLGMSANKHIVRLEDRVAALERQKTTGTNATHDLADLLERLAALEGMTQDRGMKFMGRWNRDVQYERGEVCSFNSSLWVASRGTTDAPGACSDWTKMLTADKRGEFVAAGEQ